ncbi:MAG TPA: alpha/beta hydrolase domain-containing protein, partial [Burkholderiales bacterium]|nr:alpha/beta hydrolase domain-containing protein [Burkholderiales bacterium]
KQGYTIVASGWQGDVVGGSNRVTGQYPVVTERDGRPITKLITAEMVITKPAYTLGLAFDGERAIRAYPAVAARMSEGRMMRRPGPLAEREPIANSEWSFGACPDGKNPQPSNVDVCYPAGFSPNYIYEVVYVAQDPIAMGVGFASTRDLISFLRRERTDSNPAWARGGARDGNDPLLYAIGFGRSQSGRYIKDLVREGFNADEAKRLVFDGIMPLVSGSRLTNTNIEFAVPNRVPSTITSHFYGGDQFPHTYATVVDPISKRRDGQLARCTAQRTCPKVMHVDTASEAYGARHSLVVTDGLGKADLPIPENVRVYFMPGTQHVPTTSENRGVCKHAQNPNPYRETLRALLVDMQQWIAVGTPPPPSRHGTIADGTLVPPVPAEKFPFPNIAGVRYTGIHNELSLKDLAVQPGRNIPGTSYTVLVSKIDADGNDVAGVRSVTLQVPLGTYTGWNQRRAGLMEDEFCGNPGAFFPFAKTTAERGADPRRSLQERYGNREGYVAKVATAAQKLVSERFLLPDDAQRLIDDAKRRDLGF